MVCRSPAGAVEVLALEAACVNWRAPEHEPHGAARSGEQRARDVEHALGGALLRLELPEGLEQRLGDLHLEQARPSLAARRVVMCLMSPDGA